MSAEEFTAISADLYEHGIRFRTHKTGNIGPEYLRMQSGMHELELWVHPEDVNAAMGLLQLEETAEEINKHHSAPTDYLLDLLREPLALAPEETHEILNVLNSRGITVSEIELDDYRKSHRKRLETGVPAPKGLIAAGFLMALPGGVLGLIIGFRLLYLTDLYPDGKEYLHYNRESRNHGKLILGISATVMVISAALYLISRL